MHSGYNSAYASLKHIHLQTAQIYQDQGQRWGSAEPTCLYHTYHPPFRTLNHTSTQQCSSHFICRAPLLLRVLTTSMVCRAGVWCEVRRATVMIKLFMRLCSVLCTNRYYKFVYTFISHIKQQVIYLFKTMCLRVAFFSGSNWKHLSSTPGTELF